MKLTAALPLAIATLALTGCNGLFSEIYDSLPDGIEAETGFSADPIRPERLTLQIDASAFGEWNYVSLQNKTVEKHPIPLACEGEWDGRSGIAYQEVNGNDYTLLSTTPTDTQSEPEQWDFAIHRFDVRTNHGAASRTSLTSLDHIASLNAADLRFEPDVLCSDLVMVDLTEMMGYHIGYQTIEANRVLSEWVKMDISTPPPTFEATGRVYILRLADGTYAALRMRDYMSPRGEKGHLTIDIIYPLELR